MAVDFGNTNRNANGLHYGNITALDAPTAYTVSYWIKFNAAPGNDALIFGKFESGQNGWLCTWDSTTGKARLKHVNATTTVESGLSNTAYSSSTWQHWVISWSGTNVYFYLNGASDGSVAFSAAVGSNAVDVHIGARTTGTGAEIRIADVKYWNTNLSASEAKAVYAGAIPKIGNLKFWAPCDDKTQDEVITQADPTVFGTVNNVQFEGWGPARPGWSVRSFVLGGTTPITKVISQTLGISESAASVLGLIKLSADTAGIVDAGLNIIGLIKLGADTLGLLDGDNNDIFDPAGKITETMSDSTVWTKIFPPFARRTVWTKDA